MVEHSVWKGTITGEGSTLYAATFTPGTTSNAGVTCGVSNTNANERPSDGEHPSVRHDVEE
jgi:hypothetical protein